MISFFRLRYFVPFTVLILTFYGCKQNREERVLIVYDAPAFTMDLARNVVKTAIDKGVGIDSVAYKSAHRMGDEIMKYMGILMLVDPNNVSVQWQTDLERYIQSGGGILAPNTNINQYHWSWMNKAKNTQTNNFDGGRVSFYEVGGASPSISWEQMETCFYNDCVDFDNIKTVPTPDWNRFTTKVLDADINEPMELSILPSGKVIFIEREGNFKIFDPVSSETKVLHKFNISTEGNYEDGMLGLTIDPNYKENNWIYLYYSPYGGRGRQNLSRFVLAYEDSLILTSEKILLEVPVQRETCCHSGGSINFDSEGNLFLSTGDNTSSKESDGYSPLDERPGRGPFDAQKGSSNTQDLRGKILKIRPLSDGTYAIPEGNLFPKDGSEGRPEIYAMGTRNPFRFSVDQKTGFIFWGDVGPDSGKDSELGPQSYDEWNIAKTPGNYGWPYFVADNKGYPMYDFETEEIGEVQDPNRPLNNSPNNNGSIVLPPARVPMIWYPYGASEKWPMLGTGSRSAMAGPVYYNPENFSSVKFPTYYNRKLFIYEWARSWIKVVSFDDNWNVAKIEPFLPNFEISKPIDMEFGPDGSMYLLEYGSNYFANNNDARLLKIEYAKGNRKPVPSFSIDKPRGASPLTVNLDASSSFDFDLEDEISYEWEVGDTMLVGSSQTYTFDTDGNFPIKLTVSDQFGGIGTLNKTIKVGNEPPEIDIELSTNRSFYFANITSEYKITVTDLEDGSTDDSINDDKVLVAFNYLKNPNDLALLGNEFYGGKMDNLAGKSLIANSDCKSCHDIRKKSIGPSYSDIAARYSNDYDAPLYLSDKIIKGGNGNWGASLMAAHPQHSKEEAVKMTEYILAINNETVRLPLQGQFDFIDHSPENPSGIYGIGVQYTDRGTTTMEAIRTRELILIGPPKLEAENHDEFNEVEQQRPNGGDLAFISGIKNGSYFSFKDIDLKSIRKIDFQSLLFQNVTVSLRLDSWDGEEIGRVDLISSETKKWWEVEWEMYSLNLELNDEGIHDLFFYFESENEGNLIGVDYLMFSQN